MIRTQTNVLLSGGLLAASQAMAGDLLLWQTNSLSYLYGKDFVVNPRIQQTITFEHADRWKYGDNFLFVEIGSDEPVIVRQPGKTNYAGSSLAPLEGIRRAAAMRAMSLSHRLGWPSTGTTSEWPAKQKCRPPVPQRA